MEPHYSLTDIQGLIRAGHYRITVYALNEAHQIGFDLADICDFVLNVLNLTHFYKPMPAEKAPGLWQDVYKINYEGVRVYLKLQIDYAVDARIISVKEDTS